MTNAKIVLCLCAASVGCSSGIGPCDIATAIRKAAETGEKIACGTEEIGVEPVTVVRGETAPEIYTVTIDEESENE